VILAFAFGLAGYYLRKHDWPPVPMVTALVLGPLFETNLHLTQRLSEAGRIDVLTRPVVWVLLAFMILMFAMPGLTRAGQGAARTPCVRRRRSRLLSHYFV
jgi:putative tricarboxylic transport membrane protein